MIKDKTEIYYLGNNNSIRYFSYYKTQNRQKKSPSRCYIQIKKQTRENCAGAHNKNSEGSQQKSRALGII